MPGSTHAPGNPPPPPSLTASTSLNTQVFTNTGGPPPQAGMGLLPKPMNVPPPPHLGSQHHQPRAGGGPNDYPVHRGDPFGNQRGSSIGSGRHASPPPRMGASSDRSGGAKSSDKPDRGGPTRKATSHREERRRDRSRELSRERERVRGSPPPARKRSRSPVRTRSRSPRRSTPSRSRSPPRRRARPAPRYSVSVPKFPLDLAASNVCSLKQRYSHM